MKGQLVETSSTRRSPRIRLQVPVFLRVRMSLAPSSLNSPKPQYQRQRGLIASAHILRPDQTVHLTIPPHRLRLPALSPARLLPSLRRSCGRSQPARCAFLAWNSFGRLSKSGNFLPCLLSLWVILLHSSGLSSCSFSYPISCFVIAYARNSEV